MLNIRFDDWPGRLLIQSLLSSEMGSDFSTVKVVWS